MLLSLVLFGSRARGDYRDSSDVDLLGVVENSRIREEVLLNGASLYHYPIKYLINQAISGDLFLLHLVSEGKILHDTADTFKHTCDKFQFKESYISEITQGSMIIWFLRKKPYLISDLYYKKRLIWAMRTILIARGAEDRNAIFSSNDLENFSQIQNLKNIIDQRDIVKNAELLRFAIVVARKFGMSTESLEWSNSLQAQSKAMMKAGGVAKSTVQRFISSRSKNQVSVTSELCTYI